MMISYKEHIFLSIIDNVNLQESYNQGDTNFLEMLLEAPMDDNTANKIISDKKRLSVYYQGDDKSKKGWYSIEPIRIDNKNGKNFILTYIIPKDGSKPVLKYLEQSKIVNWNVLGKKDAELPKEYEKKVLKFLSDPKIPAENKKSLLNKIEKTGVKVKDFLKKVGLGAALVGGFIAAKADKGDVGNYLRKQAPHIAQLYNTKDLNNENFREAEIKVIGELIARTIQKGGSKEKGGIEYDVYSDEVRDDLINGTALSGRSSLKQVMQDPETLVGLTLGRFSYKLNDDGSYTVTDKYDFSKWKSIKTTKKEVEGLPYPVALAKIMKDNNQSLYGAIRHMAYLETPDDVPGAEPKKIKLIIPKRYVTTYNVSAKDFKDKN